MAERQITPDPRWIRFGEWITQKQEQCVPRLSDRKLGELTGISGQFIGNIKRGINSTSPENVIAIAHALGASEQEAFMVLGMSVPGIPVEAVEFAGMLRGLDEDRKKMLMHLTRAAREALEMQAG